MGLRVLTSEQDGRSVIYDSVTDVPLPLQLFESQVAAEHFLFWTKKQDREPFGKSGLYEGDLLMRSLKDWYETCTNPETGELLDDAYNELMTAGE